MISKDQLAAARPHALLETHFEGVGSRYQGKVRDVYVKDGHRALVATDRLSAFDRNIAAIPFKGQVLNQLSAWWFEQTKDVIANHVVAVPDPNVTVGREAEPLMVEVVVRAYITGVTDTSLWMNYSQGKDPYGVQLPEGLKKNDRLPAHIVTPTTKGLAGEHDRPISSAEVVSLGILSNAQWAEVQSAALEVFRRGTEVADAAGLILVDTKYEFGIIDGVISLIDEIHTPDSSRYWRKSDYEEAMAEGREPEGLDKEYVRRWLAGQGYTGEGPVPVPPDEVVFELATRYIDLYERLTGETFVPGEQPVGPRIEKALKEWTP